MVRDTHRFMAIIAGESLGRMFSHGRGRRAAVASKISRRAPADTGHFPFACRSDTRDFQVLPPPTAIGVLRSNAEFHKQEALPAITMAAAQGARGPILLAFSTA